MYTTDDMKPMTNQRVKKSLSVIESTQKTEFDKAALEKVLAEKAKIVDQAMSGYLRPGNPVDFYSAYRWVPLAGGKRLRPIITLLACEAVGGVPEDAMPFALSLELIHNATLIHDDIMDGDTYRRGLATTHAVFGVPISILAGDALIGITFRLLSLVTPPVMRNESFKELLKSIADGAQALYEGQAQDLEYAARTDVTVEEYMDMVWKKTGQLYWLAGRGGALLGDARPKQLENLSEYGKLFGLMFQVRDDLLSILKDQAALGKQDVGSDIKNGKRTIVVTHAFNNASGTQLADLKRIIGNRSATRGDVERVIEIFNDLGSLQFAQMLLEKMEERSKKDLEVLPNTSAKALLDDLATYGVKRDY